MPVTFPSFLAFINAQSADRKIDHRGGWSSCAVGDYMKSIEESGHAIKAADKLLVQEIGRELIDHLHGTGQNVWDTATYEVPPLMVLLCVASFADELGVCLDTYGDLQRLIKERSHLPTYSS